MLHSDSFFYGVRQSNGHWIDGHQKNIGRNDDPLNYSKYISSIAFSNSLFTLLPNKEYDNAQLHNILASSGSYSGQAKYEVIQEFGSTLCYSIEPAHADFCDKKLPHASTCHIVSCLLRQLGQKSFSSLLYFHKIGTWLYFFIISDDKLLLANSFPYSAPESVLYYTQLSKKLYQLPYNIQIRMAGSTSFTKACYVLMSQYFEALEVVRPSSDTLMKVDKDIISTIETVDQCAS